MTVCSCGVLEVTLGSGSRVNLRTAGLLDKAAGMSPGLLPPGRGGGVLWVKVCVRQEEPGGVVSDRLEWPDACCSTQSARHCNQLPNPAYSNGVELQIGLPESEQE